MRVSLIIPTFNRTNLLRESLLSVLSQSRLPDELILTDDGSSEPIIDSVRDLLARADFPVRFVRQEDRGFRAARCRNNGIRQARGEVVVCFDPDIVFSKHYFKTLVGQVRKSRFAVGQVILFSEKQSGRITRDHILQGDFTPLLTEDQKRLPGQWYRKEKLYSILHALKLRRQGPKLRSGLVGFFKEDFIRVNGFDEQFIGWGNEDDDLGVRFYAAGVRGFNPFRTDYAIHLYHQRFHNDERVNKSYQKSRLKEIGSKNFRCRYGFDIHDDQGEVTVEIIK